LHDSFWNATGEFDFLSTTNPETPPLPFRQTWRRLAGSHIKNLVGDANKPQNEKPEDERALEGFRQGFPSGHPQI
jgi:hypothetical protein